MRRLIRADSQSAVDVGHLRQGTRSLKVQKPKFSEAFPEAAIREGADKLTLRADEVGTQPAFISTDHIKFEMWGPPLVDADWLSFFQAINNGIEGKAWEELYCHCRDMSKATGAKKPSESQKAKALGAMMAAWIRVRSIVIQLAKKISWAEQELAWICGKTHQRPDCGPGKSVGMVGESLPWSAFGFTVCCCQPLSSQWPAASVARRFCKICGTGPTGKASGLAWTLRTWCVCVHLPAVGMTRGKYGPHSELFLLPHQEGAGGPRAGSAVRALRLCGNAQGVCADWFAPFGSRKRSWIKCQSVSGPRRHVEIRLPRTP